MSSHDRILGVALEKCLNSSDRSGLSDVLQ
jgi:hypothetical protein